MDSDGTEIAFARAGRRMPRGRVLLCSGALAAALLASILPTRVHAQEAGTDAIRGELRAGKFPAAERRAREYLAATERLHGADSRETAEALDLLAEALRKNTKSHEPEALDVCLRALAIKERLLPPDDLSFAVSLENLGALHLLNGDLDKARAPLERALDLRTRKLGSWHPDVAWSLIWLGRLEQGASNVDSARVLVERGVAIQDSMLPDDDLKRTQGLELLASIQYDRGDYRDAASLFERILGLRLGSVGLDHVLTASVLQNLGAVYSEMGDYSEGRRYLEQARAVMRRVLAPDDPMAIRTVVSLGLIHEKQGDLTRSLALYRDAVRLQRKAFGPDHSDVGLYMMRVGRLELKLGNIGSARRTLQDALRIQERSLGPKHPELAWTLRALAEIDADGGDLDHALGRGGRALDIQETALGSHHPDIAPTLADLGRFHAMKGDTAGAIDLALRSYEVRTEHLRLTSGGLSERQALAYAATGPTGLDVALALVARGGIGGSPTFVRRTWDALTQTRTLVLDAMAARHRAVLEDSLDDATSAASRALQGARQRLSNLLVRGPENDTPDRYQALLRTARLEMERAERSLGRLNKNLVAPTTRPGLEDVLSAVPQGWGLVAYASYASGAKRRYVAFVRGASGEPTAIPIGDASRIDALSRRWALDVVGDATRDKPAAAQAEAASRKTGLALRRAIWDPVAGALGNVEGILIIPDGSLQGVNVGALPDDGHGYLVEQNFVLHYVTTELDIAATRVRAPRGSGLLALGGVEFGVSPESREKPQGGTPSPERTEEDCGGFYGARFGPLPQSRLEVNEIAGEWGDSTDALILTGGEATEAAFKRLAPGRRVLHLATHGFFIDPNQCLQELAGARGIGGLELSVRPRPRPAFDQQSPLLLSGLALAAANRRSEATPHEEDGILTAEEVASLDLRGVEWAVLSACDTGIAGAARGEGVLGLRRAFRTAGVATLVISLWPVQDEAAREWMKDLYEIRFHEGIGTAKAVRAATLEVLRARRAEGRSTSPFFWAAFVAAGDWD